MYSCPGCGAMMVYDIKAENLVCTRCDRHESVSEADQRENWKSESTFSVDLLTCPQCGAEIRAMNAAVASFCSYCGAEVMLEKKNEELQRPERIIPFRYTREECFEKYREMIGNNPFVDHRLKNVTADSFRGIYVPYFNYDARVTGNATVDGEQTKGDTTYYYSTQISLNHAYTDILHDASVEMPDVLSEQISNVIPEQIRDFSPAYISGFYADQSDMDRDNYINYAKAEAVRRGVSDVISDLQDGLTYNTAKAQKELIKNTEAEYSSTLLVPTWFMSVRSGNRVLYAVMNAVTGKMAADLPLDIPRFGLLALAVFVPLFLLLNLLITAKPGLTLTIAMILAFCSQLAVNGRLKNILIREKGGQSRDGDLMTLLKATNKRAKVSRTSGSKSNAVAGIILAVVIGFIYVLIKIGPYLSEMTMDFTRMFNQESFASVCCVLLTGGTLLLTLTGRKKKASQPVSTWVTLAVMIVSTLILILNPFHSADMPVWICAVLCIASVLWTLIRMLNLYNRGCSNPMPQFTSHTGGDDRA